MFRCLGYWYKLLLGVCCHCWEKQMMKLSDSLTLFMADLSLIPALVQLSAQYCSGTHWELSMYSNVAKVGSADSKYMNIFDRFLSEASVSVTVTGVSPIADSQYVSVESSNKNSTTWAVSSSLQECDRCRFFDN